MGQGPTRGGHSGSDEYEDRQQDAETDDAQEETDEVVQAIVDRYQETDRVDESGIGRVVGGAAGGFAGGAAGGLAGSAIGSAVGREVGERSARYLAAQANEGPSSIDEVSGVGAGKAEALREAGYESLEDIREASRDELESVEGIGTATAGQLRDAAGNAASQPGRVSQSVQDAINQTPFSAAHEGTTAEQRQAIKQATAETKEIYRAATTVFASRARNPAVAETIANQTERGRMDYESRPYYSSSVSDPSGPATLTLSPESRASDVYHELSHVMTDAYGYDRGQAGADAEQEYIRQQSPNNPDPFIEGDPDNPEYQLSQEYGRRVDDVPGEVSELVGEINQAWKRVQRAYQTGGTNAAREYTVIDNYSATSASEYFAQFNQAMQSEARELTKRDLRTLSSLVESYRSVFAPSEAVQSALDRTETDE